MKTIEPRGAQEDEDASPLESAEDPDPLSARNSQIAVSHPPSYTRIVPAANDAAPAGPATSSASADTSATSPRHDAYRIRGDALRRSLYFTMVAWIPGAFWQTATNSAAMVELAKYLGATAFIFSLLMAAPMISVLLQIPGALLVERLGSRKKFFLWTCIPHRLLYVVVGLLPWIMPVGVAWPAMIMAGVMFVSTSLNSIAGPAWTNWMSDLVPARVRGKFFARRSRMGAAVLIVTSLFIGSILDLFQGPWLTSYMAPISSWAGMPPLIFLASMIFIVAGLVGVLDIVGFIKVDEPPMRAVPRESFGARLLKPLKDSEFRRFVIYWSMWTASTAFSGWMWWLYLLEFFQAQKVAGNTAWWVEHRFLAATLILSVAFNIGTFLGYPIWGRAVDRFGRKPVLFISSTFHASGWLWWLFLSPAMLPWLLLTQVFGGFMSGGQDVAAFNMMLRFNRKGGPGYQAVASVIFSVVGAISMLLAGTLAEVLRDVTYTVGTGTGYEHTFNRYAIIILIGVALRVLADFVLLSAVHDLESKSRIHALRFVFDNTYGSLNTLIFTPLRAGARASAEIAGRSIDGVREAVVDVATDVADVASDVAETATENIRKLWR